MNEKLKKYGEVAVFLLLAGLFLFTGYVSWGHGTPELKAWFMPLITLVALGWGVWLLYLSLAEVSHLRSAGKDPNLLPKR